MVWFGTDFSLYGAMQCGFVLSKISRCGSVRGFYSQESYGAVQLPVEQLLPTVRSRAQRWTPWFSIQCTPSPHPRQNLRFGAFPPSPVDDTSCEKSNISSTIITWIPCVPQKDVWWCTLTPTGARLVGDGATPSPPSRSAHVVQLGGPSACSTSSDGAWGSLQHQACVVVRVLPIVNFTWLSQGQRAVMMCLLSTHMFIV